MVFTHTEDSIITEESQLLLKSFNASIAYKIGVFAMEYVENEYKGRDVIIDITTPAGLTLFRAVQGKAAPDNEVWIEKKRNTVVRYEMASKRFGLQITRKGRTVQSMGLDPEKFTPYGGGFPIRTVSSPDITTAVICVSGLKDDEDHDVCTNALAYAVKDL